MHSKLSGQGLATLLRDEGKCSQAMGRIASCEEIIKEVQNGRMFILLDDNSAHHQGYLVVAAQMATPDVINFMASHARGLICLALTQQRFDQLQLSMMPRHQDGHSKLAFAVSIEARSGVSTGISAPDRANTIAAAIDAGKGPEQIVTPGHVFPLVASNGGVLTHAGPAEAVVDFSRLAGLNPSGVLCAIMHEGGAVASPLDLSEFALRHGLSTVSLRSLIAYRCRRDRNMECAAVANLVSRYGGDWLAKAYVSNIDGAEHLVLQKGIIGDAGPSLVRMHPGSLLSDLLCDESSRAGLLQQAMAVIGEKGAGVIVIFRDTMPGSLSKLLMPTIRPDTELLRDYSVGSQILADLGIQELTLLSDDGDDAKAILEHFGLRVVGEESLVEAVGGAS